MAIRSAGIGSATGAIVGGGIAQFFAGPDTLGVVWLAALVGAVVSGVVSILIVHTSACSSESRGARASQSSP
jgi:hypothetical protein